MFVFLASLLFAQEPPEAEEPIPSEEPAPSDEGTDEDTQDTPEEKEDTEERAKTATEETEEDASLPDEKTESPSEKVEKSIEGDSISPILPEEEKNQKVKEDLPGEVSSEQKEKLPPVLDRARGEVVLKNGDRIHGVFSESEVGVQMDIGSGGDILIPEDAISSILYPRGKYHLKDLGYNRYFYTPTAIPMEEKTGYLSQKELLFSAVAYSPSQDWSVLAGTSIPYLLFALSELDSESLIGVVGIRYGTNIGEDLYVGGGVESFVIPYSSFSLPFVNVTYGDNEQHITAAIGLGVTDFETPRILPMNISGYKRVSRSIALVTENWLIGSPSIRYLDNDVPIQGTECGPNGEPCYGSEEVVDWNSLYFDLFASAIGVRFISQKFTTDVAIVNIFTDGEYLPLPWLDVSWYFGADLK